MIETLKLNNNFHRFFITYENSKYKIKHAVSLDGINWIENVSSLDAGLRPIKIEVLQIKNKFISFLIEERYDENEDDNKFIYHLQISISEDGFNWSEVLTLYNNEIGLYDFTDLEVSKNRYNDEIIITLYGYDDFVEKRSFKIHINKELLEEALKGNKIKIPLE